MFHQNFTKMAQAIFTKTLATQAEVDKVAHTTFSGNHVSRLFPNNKTFTGLKVVYVTTARNGVKGDAKLAITYDGFDINDPNAMPIYVGALCSTAKMDIDGNAVVASPVDGEESLQSFVDSLVNKETDQAKVLLEQKLAGKSLRCHIAKYHGVTWSGEERENIFFNHYGII